MANLNLQKAKEYFSLGVLRSVEIVRAPMSEGWLIQLRGPGNQMDVGFLADRRSGEARLFKSLDTAAGIVEDIGFKLTGFKAV